MRNIIVLSCWLAVWFATPPRPSLAQTSGASGLSARQQQTLVELLGKATSSGPESLTAEEVAVLYTLQVELAPPEVRDVQQSFFGQLVWWWSRGRGLTADEAMSELTQAWPEELPPDPIKTFLVQTLADLPAPGQPVYNPPAYVVRGPLRMVRWPRLIGRPPLLGPNEKSGMSRDRTRVR
jgi:hypothetical protein